MRERAWAVLALCLPALPTTAAAEPIIGTQLLPEPLDAGKVIGRAETVPGVRTTPLYVKTEDGLTKLEVQWGAEP